MLTPLAPSPPVQEPTVTLASAYVSSPFGFVILALALSVGVRVVLALLKCYEVTAVANASTHAFWKAVGRVLVGLGPVEDLKSGEGRGDYLTSALVGFLEFLIYPFLIAAGSWTFIAAWIGFKTLAQYKHWSDSRSMFNRFLAGNSLVIILAFAVLAPLVRFRP